MAVSLNVSSTRKRERKALMADGIIQWETRLTMILFNSSISLCFSVFGSG